MADQQTAKLVALLGDRLSLARAIWLEHQAEYGGQHLVPRAGCYPCRMANALGFELTEPRDTVPWGENAATYPPVVQVSGPNTHPRIGPDGLSYVPEDRSLGQCTGRVSRSHGPCQKAATTVVGGRPACAQHVEQVQAIVHLEANRPEHDRHGYSAADLQHHVTPAGGCACGNPDTHGPHE